MHLNRLYTFISLGLSIFSLNSCNSRLSEQRDAVAALVNTEIVLPNDISCSIMGEPVKFDIADADYTIISYIDSSDCMQCKMKLFSWNHVINELKSAEDVEVKFLMILNSPQTQNIDNIIKQENFWHPISFDSIGAFEAANSLPKSNIYHTFLLDGENRIIAVGNPAINPKIRQLYKNIIYSESPYNHDSLLCNDRALNFGVVNIGDTIRKRFELVNNSECVRTIQELVTSCDCTTVTAESDSILPGKNNMVTITYVADSLTGAVSQYVDIFYIENESPERLTIYGYVKNTND